MGRASAVRHLTAKLHAVVPDPASAALHTDAQTTFTPTGQPPCGQAGGRPYWCPSLEETVVLPTS